jgi:hypothetical protein
VQNFCVLIFPNLHGRIRQQGRLCASNVPLEHTLLCLVCFFISLLSAHSPSGQMPLGQLLGLAWQIDFLQYLHTRMSLLDSVVT